MTAAQRYHGFERSLSLRDSVMVSWMHNTAIEINDIRWEYNHRAHRGTQRIDLRTLFSLLSSVVKSGGFYCLCGINSTTTEIRSMLVYGNAVTE